MITKPAEGSVKSDVGDVDAHVGRVRAHKECAQRCDVGPVAREAQPETHEKRRFSWLGQGSSPCEHAPCNAAGVSSKSRGFWRRVKATMLVEDDNKKPTEPTATPGAGSSVGNRSDRRTLRL